MHVGEADFAKAGGQPFAAMRLSEGRGGDAGSVHLPLGKLSFLEAKTAESGAYLGQIGEARYFLFNGWDQVGVGHERVAILPFGYLITRRRRTC